MCGIIAYTGQRNCKEVLIDGLRRLEYRGYDSAGITIAHRKKLHCWKSAGKLSMLEQLLPDSIAGHFGLGHTRWATHGAANDINAHPHNDASNRIAIAHNGIIENFDTLRTELQDNGITLVSETDSEVLAHLLAASEGSLAEAMRNVLSKVQGTCGIVAIDCKVPGTIVAARNGSPVLLGIGEHEMLAASDQSALLRYTREVVHLEDGEVAELSADDFTVTRLDSKPSSKTATHISTELTDYDKGEHRHYLHREIYDQPDVIRRTLSGRLDERFSTAHLGGLNLKPRELLNISRIKILGCGSAYYAGIAGAQMIEQLARIPSSAEAAAEFRYRNPVIESSTMYIAVSQSGETFDTLAAVREIRRKGGFVLGIVNSVGSTIAREVDGGVYMHAGPEVSVASTKSYTSSLTVFSLLALMLGRLHDISPQKGSALVNAITELPEQIEQALALEKTAEQIAGVLTKNQSLFYLGRTTAYSIALEGAQKIKEISYLHAEAYPSSELKHGPLALVSDKTPCIMILPDNELLMKSIGSMEEIKTRGAPIIALTDSPHPRIDDLADYLLRTPRVDELIQAAVMAIPLQLLAYHAALKLNRDIDQPRNLAKSVTVE